VQKQSIDWLGFILLAIGMGSLQTVLEQGQQDDWFNSNLICFLTVTAVLGLILFVWWELKIKNPIVKLRTLKSRPLIAGSALSGLVGLGLYSSTFLLPVYLQQLLGYTAYESGMTLLPSAMLSMLSFMIVGPLSQKVSARILTSIGVISFSIGMLGLSQLTSSSGTADIFWPLMARGVSLGFLFIPLTIASLSSLKPDDVPTGSGFVNLSRQLGGSIGIAAFSTMLQRRADFHLAMLRQYVNSTSPNVIAWFDQVQAVVARNSSSQVLAHSDALILLNLRVIRQASMLAFNDAYILLAFAFIAIRSIDHSALGNYN
jgi:DHA2 family multidrug resistance protein